MIFQNFHTIVIYIFFYLEKTLINFISKVSFFVDYKTVFDICYFFSNFESRTIRIIFVKEKKEKGY